MNVSLEIPDEIEYQLVYRQQFGQARAAQARADVTFTFFDGAVGAARRFGLIRRHFGVLGALKAIVKLATRSRQMYLIAQEGRVVSIGWCTIGRCRYYQVERRAAVIGPIWSAEEVRGKGIATCAMRKAIDELVLRGHTTVYTDTSKSNQSAQRVFEKSGFGPPVALYLRLGPNER